MQGSGGRNTEGVGVIKHKFLTLNETKTSYTLGGSDTLRYINLTEVALGLVPLCGPMHLCSCLNEECGDREGWSCKH